jgi:hypothetical protein
LKESEFLNIASAFPNLESLDLGQCLFGWDASGYCAVLPRLRRLQAACCYGLLEGGTLKRGAPALESLLLGTTFEVDPRGSWEGHASLRELALEDVPYYLPPPRALAEGEESSESDRWDLPERTRLVDLCALQKLPALRSLRVGLRTAPLWKRVDRSSLDAGAASLHAWAGGWTRLREVSIGGTARGASPGVWFDIGGVLPVLAEQLGPHLRLLAVDPCSFVCGASEFESLPACLRACIPQFRVLERFLICFSATAGCVSMEGRVSTSPFSMHTYDFKATPELLEGLVAPLAGSLRPPRLQSAKVLLPIDFEDRGATQDEAWLAAFLRALNGYPGLRVETYSELSRGQRSKLTPWLYND